MQKPIYIYSSDFGSEKVFFFPTFCYEIHQKQRIYTWYYKYEEMNLRGIYRWLNQ